MVKDQDALTLFGPVLIPSENEDLESKAVAEKMTNTNSLYDNEIPASMRAYIKERAATACKDLFHNPEKEVTIPKWYKGENDDAEEQGEPGLLEGDDAFKATLIQDKEGTGADMLQEY
ncbi:BetA, Choline dehydrogenase, partial [Pyrenophora tritici-repentis]